MTETNRISESSGWFIPFNISTMPFNIWTSFYSRIIRDLLRITFVTIYMA